MSEFKVTYEQNTKYNKMNSYVVVEAKDTGSAIGAARRVFGSGKKRINILGIEEIKPKETT